MATPGRARPGPGADVGGVSPVPAQMWQCARCNMYRFATSCTVLQHPVLSCNFLYCLATCAALRAYDKYGEFALFLVRKGQVVRHLLHAACCMLHVARCTLSVVCCVSLLRVLFLLPSATARPRANASAHSSLSCKHSAAQPPARQPSSGMGVRFALSRSPALCRCRLPRARTRRRCWSARSVPVGQPWPGRDTVMLHAAVLGTVASLNRLRRCVVACACDLVWSDGTVPSCRVRCGGRRHRRTSVVADAAHTPWRLNVTGDRSEGTDNRIRSTHNRSKRTDAAHTGGGQRCCNMLHGVATSGVATSFATRDADQRLTMLGSATAGDCAATRPHLRRDSPTSVPRLAHICTGTRPRSGKAP